jgi:hypothetical protein
MAKFPIYQVGKFHIFRGKDDPKTWYVYDTKDERYVGGSFTTKGAAEDYAEGRKS